MKPLRPFKEYKEDLLTISVKTSNQHFQDQLNLLQSWFIVERDIQSFKNQASSYSFHLIFGEQSEHFSEIYFEKCERNFEAFCTYFTRNDKDTLLLYILDHFSD